MGRQKQGTGPGACRKWPIVHVVKGLTVQDMPVNGMRVPKNSAVIALLHGTMHDPAIFPDPDE